MRSLKKSSLALVPLALGTGLALGSVGISGAAAPKAESSTKPAVVTVDGLGLVKGKPDTITVSLGVDVNGASVSAALTRSNDRAPEE